MIDSFNFPFLGHKRAFHVPFGLLNEFRKKDKGKAFGN